MTPAQSTRFSVVKPEPETETETDAQAAARLQREAAERARLAVETALVTMSKLEAELREIAGLTASPNGVRQECRTLANHLVSSTNTIASIQGRVG